MKGCANKQVYLQESQAEYLSCKVILDNENQSAWHLNYLNI